MKKTIITAVLLVAMLLLCACTTRTTEVFRTVRWEEGETLVYDVSKDNQGSFTYEEVDGALKIPVSITGTMTMTVQKTYKNDDGSSVSEVRIETDIWNTYAKEALGGFDVSTLDKDYVKSDEEGNVMLRTTLVYESVFPLYSCTKVTVNGKGAVVIVYKSGNKVEFNDYTAVCEKFENKNATYSVTFNNGAHENIVNNVINLGSTEFADNTTLMYVVRSMDLSSLKQATSTSIIASDIVAGVKRTVSVITSASGDTRRPKTIENLLLEKMGEEEKNKLFVAKVSSGSTLRGTYNYFYMDVSEEATGDNVIRVSGKTISKNRIVAMQQGYTVFMLRGF